MMRRLRITKECREHHLQITIQQSLTGLPEFRKHSGNSAYTEGWGLYAEELGKEIGFYQDPGSDYGRLRSESFRAVRLLVDTSIHDQNWTRQHVVEYSSYKIGQLKIRGLRERARVELGWKFDLKRFHDEVLSGGGLPLDLLDDRISRWIATQLGRYCVFFVECERSGAIPRPFVVGRLARRSRVR